MPRWSSMFVCAASAGSVFVLASCGANVSDRNIKIVSLEQVRTYHVRQLADQKASILVMIDPRASRDYEEAHIPGARNIHLPDFKRGEPRDPELDAFAHIVVYGQHPGDYFAPGVTKRLLELGYKGVVFFAGGLDEWARLYNVETSKESPDS